MPDIYLEQDDVCIYVTEACNSNCIMCPMSLDSRKRGNCMTEDRWKMLPEIIPANVTHITITGGEPFLEYRHLLPAIRKISIRYPESEVLILTNGRALSLKPIIREIETYLTERFCIAVPIHAPDAKLHDEISRTPGSFDEAMAGLEMLKHTRAKIEIRIVGHRLNLDRINATFRMVADSGLRVTMINLLGMEMTGCAAANRKDLWVDYKDVCEAAMDGIRYAICRGINVGLYNFPLCSVPQELWGIVKNSITPSKVRFYNQCRLCREYDACGGLFYSTYELKLFTVKPFEG